MSKMKLISATGLLIVFVAIASSVVADSTDVVVAKDSFPLPKSLTVLVWSDHTAPTVVQDLSHSAGGGVPAPKPTVFPDLADLDVTFVPPAPLHSQCLRGPAAPCWVRVQTNTGWSAAADSPAAAVSADAPADPLRPRKDAWFLYDFTTPGFGMSGWHLTIQGIEQIVHPKRNEFIMLYPDAKHKDRSVYTYCRVADLSKGFADCATSGADAKDLVLYPTKAGQFVRKHSEFVPHADGYVSVIASVWGGSSSSSDAGDGSLPRFFLRTVSLDTGSGTWYMLGASFPATSVRGMFWSTAHSSLMVFYNDQQYQPMLAQIAEHGQLVRPQRVALQSSAGSDGWFFDADHSYLWEDAKQRLTVVVARQQGSKEGELRLAMLDVSKAAGSTLNYDFYTPTRFFTRPLRYSDSA